MPFVPLGSRKRVEVILDHDKERLTNTMRAKDNATVKLHHQDMPGATGYRYGNHPICHGPIRGPPAPFATANKPWAPPEHEPNGMAALRDSDQAPIGAYRDGSHSMNAETLRKTRSVPALVRTMAGNPLEEGGKSLGEQAKEKANPLSIELTRWQRLAAVTERDLMSMPAIMSTQKKDKIKPIKPLVTAGLVNFPKYMLFENSHLKSQDNMRFVAAEDKIRKENRERADAAEAAMAAGEVQDTPLSTSRATPSTEPVPWPPEASWGAPKLRGPDANKQWAGSAMPTGKSTRSSNPFRN